MDETIALIFQIQKRAGYDSDAELQEAVQALGDLKSLTARLNHELNVAHMRIARLRGDCRWSDHGGLLWRTSCGAEFVREDTDTLEPYCPRCGGRAVTGSAANG